MEDYESPEIIAGLKSLPRFGPNDLTHYFSSVATYYQSKLSKSTNPERIELYKKFILSTIIQLYSLTWSASARFINKRKRERKIYEKIRASKQCEAIIGVPSVDSQCWLCGYSMKDFPYTTNTPEWIGQSDTTTPPNKPQCEHVLALCAGLLFYGIPSTYEIALRDKEFYKLNYGWSHGRCNLLKSSCLFTDIFAEGTSTLLDVPTYNIKYVNTFLESLYYVLFNSLGTKENPVVSRKIAPPNKVEWIAVRERAIREKIQTLLSNISELKKRDTRIIFNELNLQNQQVDRCTSGIFEAYKESLNESKTIQVDEKTTLYQLLLQQKQMLFKPVFGETTPKLCNLPDTQKVVLELFVDNVINRDIANDIVTTCTSGGSKKRKGKNKTNKRKCLM